MCEYPRSDVDPHGRYLPEEFGGSMSSDSSASGPYLIDPKTPGYLEVKRQAFIEEEKHGSSRKRLMRTMQSLCQDAAMAGTEVSSASAGVPGESVAGPEASSSSAGAAGAEVSSSSASAKAASSAGAKAKAVPKARVRDIPEVVVCEECGQSWTLDDMDRDYHVNRLMWLTYGCQICARSDGESIAYDTQGFSQSNRDYASFDEYLSDDEVANACPVVEADGGERWEEWEDTVEEFRRSMPRSSAAMAASTLDRGRVVEFDTHGQVFGTINAYHYSGQKKASGKNGRSWPSFDSYGCSTRRATGVE